MNAPMNIGYIAATALLSVMFFVAAAAKWIQPKITRSSNPLLGITEHPAFAWVQVALATIVLLPAPILMHALAASFMGGVVVVGQIWRLRHPDEECECFGSLTPNSKPRMAGLGLVIIAACSVVIWRACNAPFERATFHWSVLIAVAVIVLLIERKMRFDVLTGVGFASRMVDLSELKGLPPDLELGVAKGVPFTASNAVAGDRPSIILAASSHCGACVNIYIALLTAASRFAAHVNLVVISHDDTLFKGETPDMTQLVSTSNTLSRFLGLKGKPYALYLRPDLTLYAPVCQGEPSVAQLLTVIGKQISAT